MGIYDPHINLDLSSGAGKATIAVIAIAIIVLILAIFFMLFQPSQPGSDSISIKFDKNPLKSSDTGKVTVTVSNNSDYDAQDVPVSVIAKEKSEFDIFPANSKFTGIIPELSKGTSREVTFLVNPVGKVLPGTYVFIASATINGRAAIKETILTVQE